MSGLRNLISHDYGAIMFEDMYNAVINDLPTLKNELLKLKERTCDKAPLGCFTSPNKI